MLHYVNTKLPLTITGPGYKQLQLSIKCRRVVTAGPQLLVLHYNVHFVSKWNNSNNMHVLTHAHTHTDTLKYTQPLTRTHTHLHK